MLRTLHIITKHYTTLHITQHYTLHNITHYTTLHITQHYTLHNITQLYLFLVDHIKKFLFVAFPLRTPFIPPMCNLVCEINYIDQIVFQRVEKFPAVCGVRRRITVFTRARPHYGPGIDSASNINEYHEDFLGGKGGWCLGLTTLPPSCADCLKIWESQPPGTLRACPGLYGDCFSF